MLMWFLYWNYAYEILDPPCGLFPSGGKLERRTIQEDTETFFVHSYNLVRLDLYLDHPTASALPLFQH
jgi:hypothetical protein